MLFVEHREEPFVGPCKVHLSMELLAVVPLWGLGGIPVPAGVPDIPLPEYAYLWSGPGGGSTIT